MDISVLTVVELSTLTCLTVLLATHDIVPLGNWNNLGQKVVLRGGIGEGPS